MFTCLVLFASVDYCITLLHFFRCIFVCTRSNKDIQIQILIHLVWCSHSHVTTAGWLPVSPHHKSNASETHTNSNSNSNSNSFIQQSSATQWQKQWTYLHQGRRLEAARGGFDFWDWRHTGFYYSASRDALLRLCTQMGTFMTPNPNACLSQTYTELTRINAKQLFHH